MGKDSKGHGSNPRNSLTRFDHGELNIPLAKRQKNIDSQLRKYTEEQRRQEASSHKAGLAAQRSRVAEAKDIVSAMPAARLKELGAKFGISSAEVKKMLVRSVESHGDRALASLRKEKG